MNLVERIFGERLICAEPSCGRSITDSELTYLGENKDGKPIYSLYHLGSCIMQALARISVETGKPIYAQYKIISRGRAREMVRLAQPPVQAVEGENK